MADHNTKAQIGISAKFQQKFIPGFINSLEVKLLAEDLQSNT